MQCHCTVRNRTSISLKWILPGQHLPTGSYIVRIIISNRCMIIFIGSCFTGNIWWQMRHEYRYWRNLKEIPKLILSCGCSAQVKMDCHLSSFTTTRKQGQDTMQLISLMVFRTDTWKRMVIRAIIISMVSGAAPAGRIQEAHIWAEKSLSSWKRKTDTRCVLELAWRAEAT